MQFLIIIILFIGHSYLFAQIDSGNGKLPRYLIHLTTINGNSLKGLLLKTNDSSVLIYPGNKKEWKSNTKYKPVEFVFSQIKEATLKRKNSALKIAGNGSNTYYLNGNRTAFIEFKKLIQ